jgi:hypothetical protein
MGKKRPLRVMWAFVMAFFMTNLPHLAYAESTDKMIPTSIVAEQLSRAQAQTKVQDYLNRDDIKKELLKRGVSPEEVSQRLAGLSDHELRQLAGQMDQALYGGSVAGILIVVVLVLLIIYLAKRI